VHCAAGKDRTGLIVAMALTLAGVPEEAVVADYVLTNERLAPRYTAERAAAALPDDVPVVSARHASPGEGPGAATGASSDIDPVTGEPVRPPRHPARNVPPGEEVMAETLAYLRGRYGSVHGYLTAAGLTQQEHDALVTRLTGPR